MSVCDDGNSYVTTARTKFNDTSIEILDLVRKHLISTADYVNESQNMRFHFIDSGRSLRVDASLMIIELLEEDLLEFVDYVYSPGELRGLYNVPHGKVILNKNLWCIETLYHELLHATSIICKNRFLYSKYLDFFEGLTELYAGFLMKQSVPKCYDQCWRKNVESGCYCIYQKKGVKIWLGLCHFIPLSFTYPLFFYEGKTDWTKLWHAFIEKIHDYGYPRFDTVIDTTKKPMYLALHQECSKVFGREYENIYNDIRNPLDLTLLKLKE